MLRNLDRVNEITKEKRFFFFFFFLFDITDSVATRFRCMAIQRCNLRNNPNINQMGKQAFN